jgi:hypothetical protein
MNISKDTYEKFYFKYVQIIYNIFLISKTSDINFGIFSWKFDENLNANINNNININTINEIKYKAYLLDDKINSLKTSCLIFINFIFNKSKKEIKDQIIKDIIYNLIKIGQDFLEYIVLNKSNYFKYFNNNNNENKNNRALNINNFNNLNNSFSLISDSYENLIFQYMVLFANVISTNPFKDNLGFDTIK